MSLSDAQAEISSNWLQYYSTMTAASTKAVSKPKTTIVPSIPTNASGPAGATALCRDGSYSYSKTHTGACSHHGGVAKWY